MVSRISVAKKVPERKCDRRVATHFWPQCEVCHSEKGYGGATQGVLERRKVWWSDARFGGATRGVAERREVWWSDARCGGATQCVVERREVWWSNAK